MKRFAYLILSCVLLFTFVACSFIKAAAATTTRQNEYPIVLVHGCGGFGRDEMLGVNYWGGLKDIQEDLKAYGYETYTGVVGPYSSNWDRACELYAYIKGGTVDYGEAHAQKYGHDRFGRTYPGIYPQWGEVADSDTGAVYKIHLVGHSMGGQTIRTLVQLLENGDPDELAVTEAEKLHPSFNDYKKSWVHSVTSISTPHDGSSLAYTVNGLLPHLQQLVAFFAATNGTVKDDIIFDYKLDQWGLKRQDDESFNDYSDRVWASEIWTNTKDISAWDLDPDGAKELNSWVKAQPDVYYFSYATEQTYESIFTKHQLPEIGMNPFLLIPATHIGSLTRNDPGHVIIDKSWWPNDGLVSVVSQDAPQVGSTDTVVNYGGTPQLGKWNYLGLLNSTDHGDVIGINLFKDVDGWYGDLADLLGSLPVED